VLTWRAQGSAGRPGPALVPWDAFARALPTRPGLLVPGVLARGWGKGVGPRRASVAMAEALPGAPLLPSVLLLAALGPSLGASLLPLDPVAAPPCGLSLLLDLALALGLLRALPSPSPLPGGVLSGAGLSGHGGRLSSSLTTMSHK